MPRRKLIAFTLILTAMSLLLAACASGDSAPAATPECVTAQDGVFTGSPCDTGPMDPDAAPTPTPAPSSGDVLHPGLTVSLTAGCAVCHTIDSVPQMQGSLGPNLTLVGAKGADFVRTSICDPNAEIADGFSPDIMPQTFCTVLDETQLSDVVEWLVSNG